MKMFRTAIVFGALALLAAGCDRPEKSANDIQAQQQKAITTQAARAVGMPDITNFREMRIM